MYFIPQITQTDCAFTALKILLANVKKDKNYLYLQEDENHGNYSYLEIIEKARNYGVELRGFRVDEKRELLKADNLPMILNIVIGQDEHCVVVYKISKKKVYYLDPNIGKVHCSITKFFLLWNGLGLLINDRIDSINEPTTIIKKKNKRFLEDFIEFISGILMISGIFIFDEKQSNLIPIILVSIGLLLEIISRIITVKKMKRFDSESLTLLDGVEEKYYSEFLSRKEKFKDTIFSNKNNFFYYLFISLLIIFAILIGNPWNIGCVFLPVITSLLHSQLIGKIQHNANIELERKEVNFKRSRSPMKAKKIYNEIHSDCYRLANNVLLEKGIYVIMFGLCSFATLIVLETLSVMNFLFLFATELYLYENLNWLFSYENTRLEGEINYMRYLNILNTKK